MRTDTPSPRRGFTLVELLVVIVVIAILTAMALAALFSVEESAKTSRTKATITKIHRTLETRWMSYRTRRVPITLQPNESRTSFAARQLLAIWDLQRMEMPDNYDDIDITKKNSRYGPPPLRVDPMENALYLAYNQWLSSNGIKLNVAAQENASAECLYLMVIVGMNAEEEIQLRPDEIDDVDNDGVPEIIDGWGRPIRWIRWAPGYLPSNPIYAADFADTDYQAASNPLGTLQVSGFDRAGVGRPGPNAAPSLVPPGNPGVYGFNLMPLVYSAGADGEWSLDESTNATDAWNPYTLYNSRWRGTPVPGIEGGGHGDNITNHRLGTR